MAVAKKVKEFDLNSVLSSAVKGETKSSSSSMPVIETSDKIAKDVDKLRELKEQLDSVKTMLDLKTAELVEAIRNERESLCKQNYTSSVKVAGTKGTTVTLTWKDAYSKIGTENEPSLRKIVGDEQYEGLFKTNTEITVKDTISEEKLTELIKAVGPENFREYFSVERSLSPKSRYTTEYFNIFNKDQRGQLEVIVKQHKPALKTK